MLRRFAVSFLMVCVGCASSAPSPAHMTADKPVGVMIVPSTQPTSDETGQQRATVRVTVPAGHKLLVRARLLHQNEPQNALYLQFVPPRGEEQVQLSTTLLDPGIDLSQPTTRVRLSVAVGDSHFQLGWFDAPGADVRGVTALGTAGLATARTERVLQAYVSKFEPEASHPGQKRPVPFHTLTVDVRLEPLSDKDLQDGQGRVSTLDPAAFPGEP